MKKFLSKIRISSFIFLVAFFICCPNYLYSDWELVGPDNFPECYYRDYIEIEFLDGIPYVVFAEHLINPEIKGISVMKLENGHWVYVGQPCFAGSFADIGVNITSAVSLAFSGNTPYVYFKDSEFEGRATVMKFNGTNWISVGPRGFTEEEIAFGNILINQGIPFVAFRGNSTTKVMKYNGVEWEYVGVPEIASSSNFTSLFFFRDTAYVTYEDGNFGNGASVKKFNGIEWINIGNPGFNNCVIWGDPIDMEFCTTEPFDGIPFVALSHGCQLNFPGVTSVYKFEDGQWEQVGNLQNLDTIYGSHACTNITFSGSIPYIAFLENGQVYVKKFDGVNWINVGSQNLLPNAGGEIDLVVNQGVLYLAYSGGVMMFQDEPLSVELNLLSAVVKDRDVLLDWSTSSETNNSHFEIERKLINDEWKNVGFVNGHGTISELMHYSFTDNNLTTGKYKYRLKQTDFNGSFEYFELADEVNIGIPNKFELSQNYPNPFNPVTNLEFGISKSGFVSLKIYDVLGRELVTLVNEIKQPGYYKIKFDAGNLSSGVYFYRLVVSSPNPMTAGLSRGADDYVAVKKFVVLK